MQLKGRVRIITCIKRYASRKISRDAYRVMHKVRMWALSELTDRDAKIALKRELDAPVGVIFESMRRLDGFRDKYEFDRAYRLLDAVVHNAAVEGVDREYAPLFDREVELGRLHLTRAFDYLTVLVPELMDLQQSMIGATEKEGATEAQLRLMREARCIVGPKSEHHDPLVRSYLSRNIVLMYLTNEMSGRDRNDVSYFAHILRQKKRSANSGN